MLHDERYDDKLLSFAYQANGIIPSMFRGDVLILGLGNAHIIKQISCDSLLIIEIDENIITKYGYGYNVIHHDAYTFKTNDKYDFIFIDIWYYKEDKSSLDRIINNYKENLKENGRFIYLPLIFD